MAIILGFPEPAGRLPCLKCHGIHAASLVLALFLYSLESGPRLGGEAVLYTAGGVCVNMVGIIPSLRFAFPLSGP